MRRIIERVVTVVTTTTWTISWQDDSFEPNPQPFDSAQDKPDVPHETAKHIQKFSSVVTTKEADGSEAGKVIDQTADEPPDNSYFDQSKKGKEKP
jgi:hypothetical protein